MYVYILKSLVIEKKYYVGITDDLEARLKEHNSGESFSTRDNRPWRIVTYLWFENSDRAERFERYLKSGSGRTFAKRYFR